MTKLSHIAFAAGLTGLFASPAAAETAVEASNIETVADSSAYRVSAAGASSVAAAQPSGSTASGWEFAVTPYLWASATKADIDTPQGEEVEVDESFIDILGSLKFAFMGAFEAKNGRFVTVHDLMFLSLGSDADGDLGPIPINADADLRLLATTHLAGYRVVDKGPLFLDVFAGARIVSVKVDLDLDIGPLSFDRERKKTEIGPVIATRFRAPIAEKWAIALYGDLGGFGVTSDLSWQLLGTIQYELSDHWSLAGGWRYFHAEQKKNDFKVDLSLSGPIFGATYRF